ncbi:MAG: tetratricopeptide repeat protein [Aequorivita sp.]
MSKKSYKISLYLIVGFCILFYGNTLTNNYSFDDEYVIVNNKKVAEGFSGISDIFKSRYVESSDQSFGYRPVVLASFAIEYEFFGAKPAVSHFINLFLYILTCLLIFKILRSLFKNNHWVLPLLITLLFVVHPIHTEVVGNVKSRDELLCFLFALLALGSAIKFARKQQKRWLFGVFAFMILSLLSKLSSLTFLVIIPLTIYFFEDLDKKGFLKLIGAMLLPVVLYKIINTQLIEATANRNLLFIENPLFVNGAGFIEKIPMAFFSVFYYLKLLFVPHPLISYYGYEHVSIVGWDNLYVWLGVVIVVPLAIYTIVKLRTKSVLVFGLAFFLITISMFSNLVKPAVGIIAERFAYIPSLGFCIVLGWGLLKLTKIDLKTQNEGQFPKLNYIFWGISGIIVIASFAKVFSRNQDWSDLVTLLKRDLEIAPKSVKLNMLLANDLFKTVTSQELEKPKKDSLMEESIFYYNQALATYQKHAPAHNNLGVLYNLKGNLKKSHEHFLEASKDESPDAQMFFNLGLSYQAVGDNMNAIENLKKSIVLNDKNYRAFYDLMNIYFEEGEVVEALETNVRMFRIFPNERKSIFTIGQSMAEATYGADTSYYIDLLLRKKAIGQKMYDAFKKQLNPSFTDN